MDALAEVTGMDLSSRHHRKTIGITAAILAEQKSPPSAENIRELPKHLRGLGWEKAAGTEEEPRRLTLKTVERHVHLVQDEPPKKPPPDRAAEEAAKRQAAAEKQQRAENLARARDNGTPFGKGVKGNA